MLAVGAYLRTLRELQRIPRSEVAEATGTNESQIVRIEAGEIDTRGSLLLAFVRFVHGNAEHVAELMLDDSATPDKGQQFAEDWWLTPRQQARIADITSHYAPEDVLAAIREIREELDRVYTRLGGRTAVTRDTRSTRGGYVPARAARRRRGWRPQRNT